MPETSAFLAERLKVEGAKTIAFFETLTDSLWSITIYTDGENWSIHKVLAHFVTSEQSFIRLFADIYAGGVGVPENFNIDSHNAAQQAKTKEQSPQMLLMQFQSVRAEMVQWVSALSASDLQKTGRHPFLGVTSLAEMIKMIYRHNQLHVRDLRQVLSEK